MSDLVIPPVDSPNEPNQELEIKQPQDTNLPQEPPKESIEKEPLSEVKDNDKLKQNIWLAQRGEVSVTIYIYCLPDSEDITVLQNPLQEDTKVITKAQESKITAKFSIPKRKQLQRYREKSSRWIELSASLVVDRFLMRQWIIRYHLLDIDIVNPSTNKTISLSREKDGKLTEASEAELENLIPNVLETLLNKFEQTVSLVY